MAQRGKPTEQSMVDVDYEEILLDDMKHAGILFCINGEEQWLSRTLVEVDPDNKIVKVPEWLAIKEGLV